MADFARGKIQPRGDQTLFSFELALDLCVPASRKQGLAPSQFFVLLGGASWLKSLFLGLLVVLEGMCLI